MRYQKLRKGITSTFAALALLSIAACSSTDKEDAVEEEVEPYRTSSQAKHFKGEPEHVRNPQLKHVLTDLKPMKLYKKNKHETVTTSVSEEDTNVRFEVGMIMDTSPLFDSLESLKTYREATPGTYEAMENVQHFTWGYVGHDDVTPRMGIVLHDSLLLRTLCSLTGPKQETPEEALAWARAHAVNLLGSCNEPLA